METIAIYVRRSISTNPQLTNVILSGAGWNIRKKTRMPALIMSIQHCNSRFTHGIKVRKRFENIQIGNEKVKLSFFTDGMILQIGKPKESPK